MNIYSIKEFKVKCLRECPVPAEQTLCDSAEKVYDFWINNIQNSDRHNECVESLYVLFLNTRKRIIGFSLVATGNLNSIMASAREIFRAAIVSNSAAIILMHNHPSGDSTPSEADIKVTRDIIRGGQLLQIEVVDHVIVGNGQKTSLKECGYFYS